MQQNSRNVKEEERVILWKFGFKAVLVPGLLLLLMAHSSESKNSTEPLTLQAIYKTNDTNKDILYSLRPPRRNDKAMKEVPRGSTYSYYYLGKSTTYFILFYTAWYILYFMAHIARSVFLHRISAPPGVLTAGKNWLPLQHWVKKRETPEENINNMALNIKTLIETYKSTS